MEIKTGSHVGGAMKPLTPEQAKVLRHLRDTDQVVNIDAKGVPFLMDGTQINRLTLQALARKQVLIPFASDLFGLAATAYEIAGEVRA
jgi:hypothetical protein